jgi:hypothetical protein
MQRIRIATRELTPFEQLVLGLLCEGKSNAAIAHDTSHTEKVVKIPSPGQLRHFLLNPIMKQILGYYSRWHFVHITGITPSIN